LRLLRIGPNGDASQIELGDFSSAWSSYDCDWQGGGTQYSATATVPTLITNADQGVLASYSVSTSTSSSAATLTYYLATTSGTGVSIAPMSVPDQQAPVQPVLQRADGSYIGTVSTSTANPMIAFTSSGSTLWMGPNDTPRIATAGGGVIGASGTTYDQNGNVTGQMASLPIQSWTWNDYEIGSINQVAGLSVLLDASFQTHQGGQYVPGTASIPVDSIANTEVKNTLTPTMWRSFAKSNCGKVFAAGMNIAIPNYSLDGVQEKQRNTNFYDVGNDSVGNLTIRAVTGGEIDSGRTLVDFLNGTHANAANANMGYSRRTAIIFKSGILSGSQPEFILVHELVLHAYAAQGDDWVFQNSVFKAHGLEQIPNSTATKPITDWISTDCTCTPGVKNGCQANTAKW
jgi:hypothetical protein